jgi:hypothetical protein
MGWQDLSEMRNFSSINERHFDMLGLILCVSHLDLLSSKDIITGKEVIHNIKEQEKRKKEFEKSVEDELRNRRGK